jgi:hypothetical protein
MNIPIDEATDQSRFSTEVAGSADAADLKLVEAYGDKLNQIEDVFKHVYHIYYCR